MARPRSHAAPPHAISEGDAADLLLAERDRRARSVASRPRQGRPDPDEPADEAPPPQDTKRSRWGAAAGLAARPRRADRRRDGRLGRHYRPEETAQSPAKSAAAPVPVTVADVSTHDVPIYLDGLGTVQASNTVAIRSQVDGKLQSVNFTEGPGGAAKATRSPSSIRARSHAALDQAKAQAGAGRGAARLGSEGSRPASRIWSARAPARSKPSTSSRPRSTSSRRRSRPTRRRSKAPRRSSAMPPSPRPIDGRIGFRQVDAGNIVHAADATPITVLTADQARLGDLHAAAAGLGAGARRRCCKGDVPVFACDQDNTHELGQGQAPADRQSDRPDDEHDPAEGLLPQ